MLTEAISELLLTEAIFCLTWNRIQTRRICEKTNASSTTMEAESDAEGINFPCPDLNEFNKLEKKLSDNADYRNKSCKIFYYIMVDTLIEGFTLC